MHERLSSELVRALRGKRSQGFVNRRLGCSSNALHAWERGTRQPCATDFLRLARLANVDVDAVLRRFSVQAVSSPNAHAMRLPPVATWIARLSHDRTQSELARQLGRARNTIARWLDGTTEPRLPDLLRFVEVTTQRLVEFVAAFVDPQALPSLRGTYRDLERQRHLAYAMPWAHAVLRALELDAYAKLPQHEAGFLARQIGISPELETECLRALAAAGQIVRRGRKWRVRRIIAVDTRENADANLLLKRHWAGVGLERLGPAALEQGNLFSYNLFAISEEGLEQIREAHLQYFERLRSIVAECRHPTRLALANVQLLALDG
jgi:transcriptional regulator with XRE-family HTH domain